MLLTIIILSIFVICILLKKFQKPSSVEETENNRHVYYKGYIRPPGVLSKFTNNEVVPFIMKAERFHGHLIA